MALILVGTDNVGSLKAMLAHEAADCRTYR